MRLLGKVGGHQCFAILKEAEEGDQWQECLCMANLDSHSFRYLQAGPSVQRKCFLIQCSVVTLR